MALMIHVWLDKDSDPAHPKWIVSQEDDEGRAPSKTLDVLSTRVEAIQSAVEESRIRGLVFLIEEGKE